MPVDDFSLRKSEEIVANALKSLSQISALIGNGPTGLEEDEDEESTSVVAENGTSSDSGNEFE